jgi:hypothetical protein
LGKPRKSWELFRKQACSFFILLSALEPVPSLSALTERRNNTLADEVRAMKKNGVDLERIVAFRTEEGIVRDKGSNG